MLFPITNHVKLKIEYCDTWKESCRNNDMTATILICFWLGDDLSCDRFKKGFSS